MFHVRRPENKDASRVSPEQLGNQFVELLWSRIDFNTVLGGGSESNVADSSELHRLLTLLTPSFKVFGAPQLLQPDIHMVICRLRLVFVSKSCSSGAY